MGDPATNRNCDQHYGGQVYLFISIYEGNITF